MPRPIPIMTACFAMFFLAVTVFAQQPIPEANVFQEVFATSASLPPYMKANAGRPVAGHGHLEAVMPRATFDSSLPDSNPALAVIFLAPGRKVTCGLRKPLSREEFGALREGAAVAFTGELVDAQDWGEWRTVYLGNCELVFEE